MSRTPGLSSLCRSLPSTLVRLVWCSLLPQEISWPVTSSVSPPYVSPFWCWWNTVARLLLTPFKSWDAWHFHLLIALWLGAPRHRQLCSGILLRDSSSQATPLPRSPCTGPCKAPWWGWSVTSSVSTPSVIPFWFWWNFVGRLQKYCYWVIMIKTFLFLHFLHIL